MFPWRPKKRKCRAQGGSEREDIRLAPLRQHAPLIYPTPSRNNKLFTTPFPNFIEDLLQKTRYGKKYALFWYV